ncbi:M48 family metalloprotease [Sphingopyxis sp. KK2]|uniref:M48 family metalloprotease n=1 Tax=Sphingopyxis sp. KK2 TaxID=1855727 RepID=UPI00097E60BA|nr:M48 family metalloprotease [Sphingopyxis sp. KK2]
MRWPTLFLLTAAAMLAPAGAAHGAASGTDARAAQEARLATIAYRLTTGSARWCPQTAPQPGWLLSDPRRFGDRDWAKAKAAYGASGDGPFIAGLAPASPAARAGLARGTGIAAINGEPVPTLSADATVRIDAIVVMLDRLDPAAALTITDDAGTVHRLDPAPGCASSFRIETSGPQAAANGKLVRLTLRLAQSIADDQEMAAVVAHELAHNILRHHDRLADGRNVDLIRQTELEADRLAVWLMADAGYDPAAAIRFWTRHKKPLVRAASHPPRKERIAAIEAEIAAMQAARAADPAAAPLELRGAFLF